MNKDYAILAGGCFWCTEAIFENVDGVISVYPGYIGGKNENPSYEEVCTGNTGHAEAVKIEFELAKISYEKILDIFFKTHDCELFYCTSHHGNRHIIQWRIQF